MLHVEAELFPPDPITLQRSFRGSKRRRKRRRKKTIESMHNMFNAPDLASKSIQFQAEKIIRQTEIIRASKFEDDLLHLFLTYTIFLFDPGEQQLDCGDRGRQPDRRERAENERDRLSVDSGASVQSYGKVRLRDKFAKHICFD